MDDPEGRRFDPGMAALGAFPRLCELFTVFEGEAAGMALIWVNS